MRDKLFLSYAWEDVELARWLSAKLPLYGYQVWRDQDRLWGGSKWISQIDTVIKDESYRMLHILSDYSRSKPNPSKERAVALQISKNRNEDFLIPLNLNVSASDLEWTLSNINYIDFSSWSTGLFSLLETLEKINAPKVQPVSDVSYIYFPDKIIIENVDDALVSNCFPFATIPQALHRYKMSIKQKYGDEMERRTECCYHRQNNEFVWAFPDLSVDGKRQKQVGGTSWQDVFVHDDIGPTKNIVKELLQLHMDRFLKTKGIKKHEKKHYYHFPRGAVENDTIKYTNYNNRKTRVSVFGRQRDGTSHFEHRLAFVFSIRPDISDVFTLQLKLRFQFYKDGQAVDGVDVNRLRKKLTKRWNNHKWISRQEAVISYLSDGQQELTVSEGLALSATPLKGFSPHSINETLLKPPVEVSHES